MINNLKIHIDDILVLDTTNTLRVAFVSYLQSLLWQSVTGEYIGGDGGLFNAYATPPATGKDGIVMRILNENEYINYNYSLITTEIATGITNKKQWRGTGVNNSGSDFLGGFLGIGNGYVLGVDGSINFDKYYAQQNAGSFLDVPNGSSILIDWTFIIND